MVNKYIDKINGIDFFKDGKHPEYKPFIGEKYNEFKILQIGESHYIDNREEDIKITLEDFEGWWDGKQSERLNNQKYWFNTTDVVENYMRGNRTKAHNIFTNALKSFCNIVLPDESFDKISVENSKKYNCFAYMNFFQIPSIYYGKSYRKSLYLAGKQEGLTDKEIDDYLCKCVVNSVKTVKNVIEAIEPKFILISSMEVNKCIDKLNDDYTEGEQVELLEYENLLFVDHPGCSWWNRVKSKNKITSKESFENKLKEVYRVKA